MDQDDCIAPDYVSCFLQLILHNYAEIAVVPQERRFVGEFHIEAPSETDYVEVLNGQEATRQMLYYNFIIAPWNKMISTELIYKNNLKFEEKLWDGEGFLFSIECFQRAEKVAVGHKRVYYDTYKAVRKVCRRKAIYAFGGPISLKEKLKAVTYMISPKFAVAVINKFRLRKYTRG